ncbi:MAG TPA: glycosyltransferase [Saprospiraceae bacterium]|nr:glycosyltransferase [Saprospiraceae bacterium]
MLVAALISGVVNLFFWLVIFPRLSGYKQKNTPVSDAKIWLVIVVRNELENLKQHLYLMLEQHSIFYETLIIDDGSTDGTFSWLSEVQNSHPDLHLLRHEKSIGKKMALHKALPTLDGTHFIFTDGDCACKSENWLSLMLSGLNEQKTIVLGYAPLNKMKTFISIFARYETFLTALQYFSYALAGLPYMGVGRNLAYHTSVLNKSKGFSTHMDLLSGDDDLLVNSVANKNNVRIQTDPESFMYSDPPKTIRAFFRQKSRHITTSVRYKKIHQILLALFSASHIVFYLALFLSGSLFAPAIWGMRIVLIYLFNYKAFLKLKEKDLLLYFPCLDCLMFVYYSFMSFSFIFPNKKNW